jgi:ADP-ribose pyrophosphatase YjhB (NUDIX family)
MGFFGTMTTDRRFCRFSKAPSTAAFSVTEIPEEGLCLSAFLIVTEARHPTNVLLGHMNPEAPWDHIGALDPKRIEVHSRGWMLPSSHLIYRESPQEAARRIAREQLELADLTLSRPMVVSEVYTPKRFPGTAQHWDIEFLFRGELAAKDVPHPAAWRELAFVDLRRTSKAEIARSHEDVIESAGLRFGAD